MGNKHSNTSSTNQNNSNIVNDVINNNNTTNDNTINDNTIKYLDIIQTNPKEFNEMQKLKRIEYGKTYGETELNKILYSLKHHELKSQKTIDYRLNDEELNLLLKNKILFKKGISNSFGKHLFDFYNHDMPVFITSDLMLYALHSFYDNALKEIDIDLIIKLKKLCEYILNDIHNQPTDLTDIESKYLKDLELFFIIPYYLLFNEDSAYLFINNSRDLYVNPNKAKKYLTDNLILPKFNIMDNINTIIGDIKANRLNMIDMENIKFEFDPTSFKSRGHYSKEIILTYYFKAFNWFTNCIIKLNKNDINYNKGIIFSSLISKISENYIEEILSIENIITKIIGNFDNYTVSSFLNELNKNNIVYPSKFNIKHFILNNNNLTDIVLTKKCKLTKFNDNIENITEFCFSFIGKGSTYDNEIISFFVDKKFEESNSVNKKFPSIFEITFCLFHNESSIDFIDKNYKNYYDNVKNNINIEAKSIYEQELLLIKSLSKYPNIEPFNTKQWMYKQLQTQIAHYNEIRHDNVLYNDEYYGAETLCSYKDIMIEPCVEFWQEFLNLIALLKTIFTDDYCIDILNNFKNIIDKFILFINYYLNNQVIPTELIESLKCIIDERYHGSGSPTYSGWYPKLFYDKSKCMYNSIETSTFFTAPDDNRGAGGICHLGNGNVKIMYIIINNSVFVAPVYTIYNFITPKNIRYDDADWNINKKNYNELNFNII